MIQHSLKKENIVAAKAFSNASKYIIKRREYFYKYFLLIHQL